LHVNKTVFLHGGLQFTRKRKISDLNPIFDNSYLLKDKLERPTRKIIGHNTELDFFVKKGIATAVVRPTMTIQYGRYFGFKVIWLENKVGYSHFLFHKKIFRSWKILPWRQKFLKSWKWFKILKEINAIKSKNGSHRLYFRVK
jgi:hypothetical protein